MKKGIYAIICDAENKLYIGSSKNIGRRWSEHKRELNKHIHRNEFLQLDWDCYGSDYFTFMILEETEELIAREHFWTNFYSNNYNIVKDAWNPMREQKYVDKMITTKWNSGNKLTFRQKLLESDVRDIIIRINSGESDISIAKDYNVLRGTIWSIKTGNTWKHLYHLITPQKTYTEKRKEIIEEGLSLLEKGYSVEYVSKKLNRKPNTVSLWAKNLSISNT
jgi:group I intron endonuclease